MHPTQPRFVGAPFASHRSEASSLVPTQESASHATFPHRHSHSCDRIAGVRGIEDCVLIAAAPVDNAALQAHLQARVHSHKIVVTVHRGAMVLNGNNVDPLVATRTCRIVAETPGVRNLTSNLGLRKGVYSGNAPPPYTVSSLP